MGYDANEGASTVPAGWYDDPGGSGQLRYWTGSAWSGSLRAAPEPRTVDRVRDGATSTDDDAITVDRPAVNDGHPTSAAPQPRAAELIVEVLETSAGLSLTQLSRETGLSRSEALSGVDELQRAGQVVGDHGQPTRYYRAHGAALTHSSTTAAMQPPPGVVVTGHDRGWGAATAPAPTAGSALTFGEAISRGIDRALDFKGRSTRPEYWWFALFAVLVGVAALILVAIPGIGIFLAGLIWLAVGIAQMAAGVRRLHDTGRSGAWVFWLSIAPVLVQLMAIPALGSEAYGAALALYLGGALLGGVAGIVLLIMLAMPGDSQPNRYGQPPQ